MKFIDDYSPSEPREASTFTCMCTKCGSSDVTVQINIDVWADRGDNLSVEVVCNTCNNAEEIFQ